MAFSPQVRAKSIKPDEANDPLGNALRALRGNDPLVETAERQIWRQLWVRDTISDWIGRLVVDPRFFAELHKAMPDDVGLLQEIRKIAASADQSFPAICIVGLVNERLERCQSNKDYSICGVSPSAPRESVAASLFKQRLGYSPVSDRINYSGFICGGIQKRDGSWIAGTEEFPNDEAVLPVKTPSRLLLWLQPDQPAGAWADKILIETGQEIDWVNFNFEVDCATLHLPYGQKRIRFHRREKSGVVAFDFVTPPRAGEHVIFVHVFQASLLVKTLEVILKVGGKR